MKIEIRKAIAKDAPAIALLNSAFNDVIYDEVQIAERLTQNASYETLFLAEVNSAAVGFLCLRILSQICSDSPYAEVSELYVEEEFRRKGIARALMDRAIAISREARARELIVLTNFRNHAAHQFYFGSGFENYCISLRRRLR